MIFALTLALALFQSCGQTESSSPDGNGNQKPIQLGPTAHYHKVSYYPPYGNEQGSRLDVDLKAGTVSIDGNNCVLDAERGYRLKDILSIAQVCTPAPLPPGTPVCMAMGIADTQLANDQESIELRPVICNDGVFLCDGRDQELREVLMDLRNRPPADCL